MMRMASGGSVGASAAVFWATCLLARLAGAAPPPNPYTDPPREVFEGSAFAGYLHWDMGNLALAERASFRDTNGESRVCGPTRERAPLFDCVPEHDYAFSDMPLLALGIRVFAGYRVAGPVAVGATLLFGGTVGRTTGWILAGGPAGRWQIVPKLAVGAAFVVGDTPQRTSVDTLQVTGVDLSTHQVHLDQHVEAHSKAKLRLGPALEISWTLERTKSGSLLLQSTPLILWTNGESAVLLPVGMAYGWP